MKIFIIDDDEMSIFLTQQSLRLKGVPAEINGFLDAEEALAILTRTYVADLPDVILLDLNMPVMDGWEFLEEIGAIPSEKRLKQYQIYILTSSLDPADVRKARENTLVKGVIHKPISSEDIEVILHLK